MPEQPSWKTSTLSQIVMALCAGYILMAVVIGGVAAVTRDVALLSACLDKLEGLLMLVIGPYAMREGLKRGVEAIKAENGKTVYQDSGVEAIKAENGKTVYQDSANPPSEIKGGATFSAGGA